MIQVGEDLRGDDVALLVPRPPRFPAQEAGEQYFRIDDGRAGGFWELEVAVQDQLIGGEDGAIGGMEEGGFVGHQLFDPITVLTQHLDASEQLAVGQVGDEAAAP
jgi:hypothetical protein